MPQRIRTILSLALALAGLLSPAAAPALDVGGPGRDLEVGKSVTGVGFSYTSFELGAEDFSSRALMGKAAFGVAAGVTPYLKVGFADLSAPAGDGTLGFAYGGGVLLRLMSPASPDGLSLAADLQGVRAESEISGVSVPATHLQGALLGSTRSGGTTTYGGIAVTSIDVKGSSGKTRSHVLFGFDYLVDLNFFLTGEAHLFGEDSLSFGVGYQF